MVAARQLQVDLVAQPQLVWLVDVCLACDYLPAGWAPVPREEMTQMPRSPRSQAFSAFATTGDGRDVTWLPPMERLWHLATTGQTPPQYTFHMCSIATERHPLSGFVRTVLGIDQA